VVGEEAEEEEAAGGMEVLRRVQRRPWAWGLTRVFRIWQAIYSSTQYTVHHHSTGTVVLQYIVYV
jgi:hypothetical protein